MSEAFLADVEAIQHVSGGVVTCHTYVPDLARFIPQTLISHRHSFCDLIKVSHHRECLNYCLMGWQSRMQRDPQAGVYRCPFGAWQCHQPVRVRNIVCAQLFLSPFRIPQDLHPSRKVPGVLGQLEIRESATLQHYLSLLALLAKRLEDSILQGVPEESSVGLSTRIENYIAWRCMESIRLPELAEYLHLSPSRTSHLVREATGHSFRELVVEYRLRLARKMLRDGATVKHAAAACGFRETPVLSRFFRRKFKITPRTFRQQSSRCSTGKRA